MSFTTLNITDYVSTVDSVVYPAWSNGKSSLANGGVPYTASYTSSGNFYLDVYNDSIETPVLSAYTSLARQYTIAYGHVSGSGSIRPFNPLVPSKTPTSVTYGQYRTLVYGSENAVFNFGTGNTSATDIFVITIDRNRYKESLYPSTFNLNLIQQAAGANQGKVIQLTTNIQDIASNNLAIPYLDCGRAFDIVSGSDGKAITNLVSGTTRAGYTSAGSYGLFLPDVGIIILNPKALALGYANGGILLTPTTTPASMSAVPQIQLSNAISNAAETAGQVGFILDSEETVASSILFVKVDGENYNYTSNPTFINGSGAITYDTLVDNPRTYVTTVGLYNANQDLLAVAKLSKPLPKDFTKELLVRVKLDW
jgi:hypothetical protein